MTREEMATPEPLGLARLIDESRHTPSLRTERKTAGKEAGLVGAQGETNMTPAGSVAEKADETRSARGQRSSCPVEAIPMRTKDEDQQDKARKIDTILIDPNNRRVCEDQMRFFCEWHAQWSKDTEKYRRVDAKVQGKMFDAIRKGASHDGAVKRQNLRAREERLAKHEPPQDPWEQVRDISNPTGDDYANNLWLALHPATPETPADESHTLSAQYVQLAILRDMALRDDAAIQSITYGVLDSGEVEVTYDDMSAGWWVGWSSTIDAAIAAVESDLGTTKIGKGGRKTLSEREARI